MTDTSDEPVAVILAGGQGSRLWPISRDRRPKQFQPVVRDRPLLTGTIERLSEIVDPSRIHVSTRARFADAARATLGPVPPENLILEEDPAGPATAFALSIATLAHIYGNAPALIAPSDHLINEEEAFNAASRDMLDQLIERHRSRWWCSAPSPPATTPASATSTRKGGDGTVEVIDSFHEKPDQATVDELAETGSLYWNTACYGVRVGQACDAYRTALPLIFDSIERFARGCAGRAGLPRRRDRRPRDLPTALGRDGVPGGAPPRSAGPTSAPGRGSSGCWPTSGSRRSARRCSWTPRTCSSRAWTVARSSRSARRA